MLLPSDHSKKKNKSLIKRRKINKQHGRGEARQKKHQKKTSAVIGKVHSRKIIRICYKHLKSYKYLSFFTLLIIRYISCPTNSSQPTTNWTGRSKGYYHLFLTSLSLFLSIGKPRSVYNMYIYIYIL